MGSYTKEFESWLDAQGLQQSEESGVFTLGDSFLLKRAGLDLLSLSDIPILLLASAVEAKANFFRVYGSSDCRMEWDAEAGPSFALALRALRHFGVDYAQFEKRLVSLPPLFWKLLGPLERRTKNAPLVWIWQESVLRDGRNSLDLVMERSSDPGLTLVDRGVDFAMPFVLPGMRVTMRVDKLAGEPWPARLVLDHNLLGALAELGQGELF